MKFIRGVVNGERAYTISHGSFVVMFYNYKKIEFRSMDFKPCYQVVLWWVSFTYWNDEWINNILRKHNL